MKYKYQNKILSELKVVPPEEGNWVWGGVGQGVLFFIFFDKVKMVEIWCL